MRVLQAIRDHIRGGLGAACLVASLLLSTPLAAGAAGTSYGGTGSGGGAGGIGVPGAVVRTCNASNGFSSCSARIGRFLVAVTIPSGDLHPGSQLVITSTSARGAGQHLFQLFSVGVGVFRQGSFTVGDFETPLALVARGPGLFSGTQVFADSAAGWVHIAAAASLGHVAFSVPSSHLYSVENTTPSPAPHGLRS